MWLQGWDATPGDIPQGTRIEGNVMRESGIWEKQSSCFFQAKTAGSILLRNLCYNLPRAVSPQATMRLQLFGKK